MADKSLCHSELNKVPGHPFRSEALDEYDGA